MGQTSSSSTAISSDLSRQGSTLSHLLALQTPVINRLGGGDVGGDGDRDFTDDVPDECLAYIFHFLRSDDRKRCSLVCKRWLRVDGQNRHRLSLGAQSELVSDLPCLFTRFDAVTKLTLRCDRKSASIDDEGLIFISIRCRNLVRLKLRGCRDITDYGIAIFAQNCRGLKKLSCSSCLFGPKGMNAILDNCTGLEELSLKRLRGFRDGVESINPGAAASSLKSICLKDLINGKCFEQLITGSKNLKALKIIRCVGDWDGLLQMIGNKQSILSEIHLERLQVSDAGLSAIANCSVMETLRIIKNTECTNLGLASVAERCKLLRKLHIDGWRTNRIGDEGLVAIATQCPELQELILIGVNATHMSFAVIGSSCQKLQRLAFCGSDTIGDTEIACIAAKCVALKKLCIKGCPISDNGIEALAYGCPNLDKVKVKKCRGVSGEAAEWLRERRESLAINFDATGTETLLDAIAMDGGAQESGIEFLPTDVQITNADASSSSNSRLTLLRAKLGLLTGRNLVPCTFRRWSNSDNSSNGNL